MTLSAQYMDQPFDGAIDFFKNKLNLPTGRWDDLWKEQHAVAFVSAGATKRELLEDMRSAVDKAISKGTTLDEFRRDFDVMVAKHGWKYKGNRGWRTRVIYNTNLSTAYAAGHWQRMTEPDMLKARPYLRYIESSSATPRAEHLGWAGTVLPAGDPWWQTHYPPNGWGCKCGVTSHSAREVERLEKDGVVKRTEAPEIKTYQYTRKSTGEIINVPEGIDPGWDYNVGQAKQRLSSHAPKGFDPASRKNYLSALSKIEQPKTPIEKLPAKQLTDDLQLPPHQQSGMDEEGYINTFLAEFDASIGDPAVYTDVVGDRMIISEQLFMDRAENKLKVFKADRERYLPMLADTIKDPVEVRLTMVEKDGKTRVCKRYIGIYQGRKKKIPGFVVFDLVGDEWGGTTVFKPGTMEYLDKQRTGTLLYIKK